jgi:uncharacterized DUF497 family protein
VEQIIFDWDQWNGLKNEIKHGVSRLEAESAFYDLEYKIFLDIKHSTPRESRYILYGKSLEQRVLMIGFVHRKSKVRIITARPSSRRERATYENKKIKP